MDHREIEEKDVLERYLQDRLDADEATRFEAHLLECGECFEQVRWGDDMGRALRVAAAEDVTRAAASAGLVAWLLRARSLRMAAGILALALLLTPSALYLRELGKSRLLLEPQVNVPVFALGATRDGAVHRVSPGAAPEWIVLTLDLPYVEHESYRATLVATGEEEVWQGTGLLPDAGDRLTVSFHSTRLAPGRYELRVTGPDGGGTAEIFAFEVVR